MQKLHACPVCDSQAIASFIQTQAQMHPGSETFNFDRCSDCGLVFLNPRVMPEDLGAYYTDSYLPYRGAAAWGKYGKLVDQDQHKLDQRRTALVQRHCRLTSASTVLDIGCGKPDFLKTCIQQTGCRGVGLDFSDHGWHDDPALPQELQLRVGEIDQLPSDLKADAITMWHYLEHDYDPVATLRRLHRQARSETVLVIEVPDFDSEGRRQFGPHWAGYHTPRHLSLFSPSNLRLLLEKSGWRPLEINTWGTLDPYVLHWMSRMEHKGVDWERSMEPHFFSFVAGMLTFRLTRWPHKKRRLGIMTAAAVPA